jgi:hypothetical protein
MQDIHPEFCNKVKGLYQQYKSKVAEYDELVTGNIHFPKRMKGVGMLSAKDAVSYGCTGPTQGVVAFLVISVNYIPMMFTTRFNSMRYSKTAAIPWHGIS